jgi:hypothetical protein
MTETVRPVSVTTETGGADKFVQLAGATSVKLKRVKCEICSRENGIDVFSRIT